MARCLNWEAYDGAIGRMANIDWRSGESVVSLAHRIAIEHYCICDTILRVLARDFRCPNSAAPRPAPVYDT